MERSNSVNSSTPIGTSSTPLPDTQKKPGTHHSRRVLPKTAPLRKFFMPRKQFQQWLSHTVARQTLVARRAKVISSLHPAAHAAHWLDHDLAFDRTKGLSLQYSEYDPIHAKTNQLIALQHDPAAKPLTLLEKLKHRLGWESFTKKNQKDIAHYVKQVVQHAKTPHALTHLHQQAWQMMHEGDISHQQFHQLSRALQKQFKAQLPAMCESLQKVDYALLSRDEATQVLKHCYDLAIALKIAAPSLLKSSFPGKADSVQKTLQEHAITAYKRTVTELKLYENNEVNWYIKDSLSLMHDVLNPVLRATGDRPWRSLKASQKKVQQQMRDIQSDTMTAHYRLYKQTKMASETLSHHEQLQKKHKNLEDNIKLLKDDMALLKSARKQLKTDYYDMKGSLVDAADEEQKGKIKQRMRQTKQTIKQISRGIRNIHKKRQKANATLTNTTLSLVLSQKDAERYQHPARYHFRLLYESGDITDDDLAKLNAAFNYVKTTLNWPEEAVDNLLDNYVNWVSMASIEPYEALHYLNQAIAIHTELKKKGEIPDLDDILFDTTDALHDYLSQK